MWNPINNISDMISPGGNPANKANQQLDQIPGQMKPYYDPYINAGRSSLTDLQGQYADLMNDPGSILARIGRGYKESPGFKFQRDQGLNSINNAAAAGGMMGTSSHQQNAGELSENLANKDYGDYMRQAMGLWGQGLAGKEDLNHMGFDASTGFARNLADISGSKAGYAFEGAAGKNKQISDLIAMMIAGGAKKAL